MSKQDETIGGFFGVCSGASVLAFSAGLGIHYYGAGGFFMGVGIGIPLGVITAIATCAVVLWLCEKSYL